MVEVKLSKRAEQVLASLRGGVADAAIQNLTLNPSPLAERESAARSSPFTKNHRLDLAGALSTRGEGASQREAGEVCIRQATLGQELGCSRWTIGRAIKKLKEAGLLLETGRDKQSRCKTYALQVPSPLGGEGLGVRVPQPDPGLVAGVTKIPLTPLCQRGEIQLQNYRHLFECNLGNWPDWEKHYAAVTWELKDVECIHKLFRQTFDKLYEIRDRETGLLCQQFTEKQGSDTSFTRMRGRTASCPHRRPWR